MKKSKSEMVSVIAVERFTAELLAQIEIVAFRFPSARPLTDKLISDIRQAYDDTIGRRKVTAQAL